MLFLGAKGRRQQHSQSTCTRLLQLRPRKCRPNEGLNALMITSRTFISIETLSVDESDHKAGSVKFDIPQAAADRIKDFLAMTGLKETQEICKGQNVKRVDPVEECVQHIQRHAMDLADNGPTNLIQLAQQNIPIGPPAGQAISFPIKNIAADGVPMIIPVYRVVYEHRPRRRPNLNLGWDPLILSTSAIAMAIAAYGALSLGETFRDIIIPKDKLMTDLTEDKLRCPKDIYCVEDDCLGQAEGSNDWGYGAAYCKKVCRAQNYC